MAGAAADPITFDDFLKVDVRVGQIVARLSADRDRPGPALTEKAMT